MTDTRPLPVMTRLRSRIAADATQIPVLTTAGFNLGARKRIGGEFVRCTGLGVDALGWPVLTGCERGLSPEEGGTEPRSWPGGTPVVEMDWSTAEVVEGAGPPAATAADEGRSIYVPGEAGEAGRFYMGLKAQDGSVEWAEYNRATLFLTRTLSGDAFTLPTIPPWIATVVVSLDTEGAAAYDYLAEIINTGDVAEGTMLVIKLAVNEHNIQVFDPDNIQNLATSQFLPKVLISVMENVTLRWDTSAFPQSIWLEHTKSPLSPLSSDEGARSLASDTLHMGRIPPEVAILHQVIDTESGASDTLSTISTIGDVRTGTRLSLSIANNSRVVKLDEFGNILLGGSQLLGEATLRKTWHRIELMWFETTGKWHEIARSFPGLYLADGGSISLRERDVLNFTPGAAWALSDGGAGQGNIAAVFGTSANQFAEGNHSHSPTKVYATIGPFFLPNVPANGDSLMRTVHLPTTTSVASDSGGAFRMPLAGRVLGGFVQSNEARTAGNLTLRGAIAGVTNTSFNFGRLDATQTLRNGGYSASGMSFNADQAVGASIESSSWEPVTADVMALLFVEMDR